MTVSGVVVLLARRRINEQARRRAMADVTSARDAFGYDDAESR